MKIRPLILPILFVCLSGVFIQRAFQAGGQFQYHEGFVVLMSLTAVVVLTLAVFIWRNAALQDAWYSRPFEMGLLLVGLIVTSGAGFFPQRSIDYVSAPVDEAVTTTGPGTQPLQLQSGAVVNLPEGEKTLLDWLRDFSSPNIQQYQGQDIDVTGFVVYSTRTSLGQFTINRMTLTCCIPDPVPVGLPVKWQSGTRLAENTWVRVTGTVAIVNVNGAGYPEIQARQVDVINKPDQPYLFPK